MIIQIPIKSKDVLTIILSLIAFEFILTAIFITDFYSGHPYWQVCELFDLDREANIPTWFSTIQLFMTGLIALSICTKKNLIAPPSKRLVTIFGLGFIYLSMDEASAIHEKITYVFYNNPMVPYFEGIHGVWIVVYGLIAIVLTIFLHRDLIALFKEHKRTSLIFLAGIIVYLVGAGGAETITFFKLDKSNPLIYMMEVLTEELFEMIGASVMLGATLLLSIKKLE